MHLSEISRGVAQCDLTRLNFDENKGSILSPDYPDGYYPGEFCKWRVRTNLENFLIVVEFKEIRMSNRNSICSGILTINGGKETQE